MAFCLSSVLADVTVTEPTGGQNLSADKALNSTNGAAFTPLGNIVITEGLADDFANGSGVTLILTPPLGWQFKPGTGSVSFTPGRNLSAGSVAVAADSATVTFTVSGAPAFDTLTISSLQVQALDGTIDPFADPFIRRTFDNPGTAVIAGIFEDFTTFGQLYQLAGAARALAIQTQPPASATAGVIFNPQPVLRVLDQFGNFREMDFTTVVTASRASGSGTLQGTTNITAQFGTVSYADLSHNVVGTITIQFTGTNLTTVTSDPIVVGPGIANRLVFTTQPGAATSGAPFGVQPVVKSRDQFGNDSTVGLPASRTVSMALTSGTGPLLGTTNLDIGTAAGNGTATFTDLQIDATGNNKQLTASATGFTNGVSATFSVAGGSFSKLQVLLPGETAAPGTPSGKTGTPNVQTAGSAFTITVNAVDDSWNLNDTITDAVGITASDANAVLPANAPLVNGTRTFSVTLKTAGTASVTASDLTDPSKTNNTSSTLTVNAGALAKMQLLVPGETAAPGSASGKLGTPTAQTAGSVFNLTVNAVDANWNVVNTNDTVAISSSDPNAALPANAALTNGTRILTCTFKTAGSRTLTASNVTHTAIAVSTSPAIAVSPGAFTKLQLLAPGETASPGSGSGKTGTPSAQTVGSPFTVSVKAVDDNWNLLTNVTDTVGFSSSDSLATLPPNAPLVAGTQNFNVTFNTSGSQTLTASNLTTSGIAPSTSSAISVTGGGLAKLQVLLPGETAAPNTPSGKTGTPTPQTAGTPFTITVNSVDATWNIISTNDTVAITSSDANATLPANAALVNGTRTFSVTLKTAGIATVTVSDVTHPGVAANTSSNVTIAAGAFVKLQLLAPGETASPGSGNGKTGTPSAQAAGTAFNVTVNAVDVNWNLVTNATHTVGITSSDSNATLPTNAALVAGAKTFSVTLNTAGSRTLTATDITDGTKTNSTSPNITVNVGSFTKLQLLVPGETAAPGTATGKTGTPTARTAGTAFNVTVNAVDTSWNLVTNVTDTVAITSSDVNATMPGNSALVAGTKTFSVTLPTAGSPTLTASDVSNGGKTPNTSPALTVNPGAVAKLQILLPGETAAPGSAPGKTGSPSAQTAGTAIANGIRVNAVDANWNVVTSSVPNVVITTSDSNATIADDNSTTAGNLTLVAGTRTLSSLTFKTAGTRTVTATDATGTLTANTSPNVTVNAGAFTKLQLLVPGETAAPGSASGKTGTTAGQNATSPFNLTVNAVDANWNRVSTVTDLIGITSSDPLATLPASTNLSAGTQDLEFTFNTAGSQTITATNLTDGSKTANTSPAITVGTVQYVAATGGGAISADNTGGAWTTLTGPGYFERAAGQVGTGTIILNAPGGFIFDTGGTAPTVLIQRASGASGAANINGAANLGTAFSMTSVTTTQLVFTVTSSSSGSTFSRMTWQNVRVRPTAGTPLASGNLRVTGTASLLTVTTNSNFGSLAEVPGAAGLLVIQTQPSTTATAGVAFAQQPVIQVQDQFGNLRSAANGASDNSTVVTAARSAGSGTLLGTTSVTASDGIVTFGNLRHNVANDITIAFSASGATGATSTTVSVNAAAASALAFTTQPGGATAGSVFGTQPVVKSQDQFGNNSTNGLPASLNVTVGLTSGTGPLQGTATLDIGTSAGNGVATFTNLRIDSAGTNQQLTATAGLTSVASGTFTVLPAPATTLVIQTQPPASVTAGATFSPAVVVRLQDAFGNLVTTDSSTVVTATRNAGTAALQGTTSVTVSAGVATFASLSYNKAETITIDFSSGSLTGATSSIVTVNPEAASKLTIQTQPSSTTTAGVVLAQQPQVRIEDQFGNLRSSDNSTVVTAARLAGSGALQGTTTATAVGGVAMFTNLSHNVATNITIQFTSSGLTGATSGTVAVSPAAANKLTIQTQPSATAAAGVVFAQQPVVRIEDQFGNLRSSDNSTSVTATRNAGSGDLQGTTNLTALNGVVTFSNLSHNVATTLSIDFTAGGLSSATSSNVVVSPAAAASLAFVAQPTDAVAGAVIGPAVTVQAQDAFGNNVSALSVTISLSTGSGSLSGTTTRSTSAGGIATFDNLSVNLAGLKKLTATSGALSTGESAAFTITPAAADHLAIQTQPSSTATAGVVFAQQPVIRIEDQFGNLINNDNNTVVIATRSAGSGTLQGTTNLTAAGGVVAFTNLSHNVATTLTIVFSATGLTSVSSSNVVVSPAAFTKLQMLVPGETAAPGTAIGKTGTPAVQTAGTTFSTTVNAVDNFWNVINTNDTVAIASTDANATLPASAALVSGTKSFSVTLKTAGSQTASASDVTHPTITSDTSPALAVNPGAVTKLQILVPGETAAPGTASGKTGSPTAQAAGTAIASGIVVNAVDANWNVVASATPNVTITTTDPNAVIADDNGGTAGNLTLVSGTRTLSALTFRTVGTRTVTASDPSGTLTANTSSSLTVNAGAFVKLQLLVPGETAAPGTTTGKTGAPTARTAGTPFSVTVRAVDAAWNLVTNATDNVGITSSDANAALPAASHLAAGTANFSVTLKTVGSRTITASDLDNGSMTANTSPSITVNVGAFAKLQVLAPGEIAAPGSATGKTGTPNAQTAGTAFNVTVNSVDANWNLISTNDTVAITSSDANATLPANAALTSGTRAFSVTLKTGGTATVTASNTTHPGITANTSTAIPINAGAFTKLQLLLPGETASPGSATGKTGTPTAQTAAAPFSVTVNAVDANWNLVSSAADTVGITSSDTNAVLPANAALAGGTQTFSVTLKTSGTRTLTASDVADGSKTANTNSVTVNAGAFVKLQLLVPGETAAPGTGTGKTGTPSAQTAGTGYTVTVRAVDADWNVVSNVTHTVGITSSESTAGLPSNAALVSGSRTFSVTNKTVGSWTDTATDITDGTKTASTSPPITVNAGAVTKLQILLPGETAAPGTATGKTGSPIAQTAGTVIANGIVVNAVDANWNVITTATTNVTITSSDANAVIADDNGATTGNLTLVSGTRTLSSLTFKTAGTRTVTASASGLTSSTSANVTVDAGAFVKLQLLVPGETAAPGTANGKTGTPTAQSVFTGFNVTANAVDANWNLVSSASDTVGITSSDPTATLPANAPLVGGTRSASVMFNSTGSFTVTATDVSDGGKTNNISPAITVGVAQFTQATGGNAISADGAAGAGTFTALTGPTYTENNSGEVGTGTIILNAPAGFVFDTGGTAPTVFIERSSGAGSFNVNGAPNNGTSFSMTSVTTTQLTFTVTGSSSGSTASKLTWQNVRVRPTAGTPLALGNLTRSGTANVVGLTDVNLGTLREVPGAPATLAIQTQPSATATAGVAFAQQPVVLLSDQFGNSCTNNNTAIVTAARNAGSGTLQGTTGVTSVAGVATFANLSHNVATTITIDFTSPGATTATSSSVTISPAAASKLAFTTQPGNATAGAPFGTQPVIKSQDAFGNNSTAGLAANENVTVSLTSGTGSLLGTTTMDIGTSAGNGTVTFTNLEIDVAGTKQLTATDGALTSAVSSNFTVNPGAAVAMVIQTQPPASATAGVAFSPAPVIRLEDAFGNQATTDNSTVVTASRNLGTASLQGTTSVAASGGLVTFANLSYNVAETINLNFTSGGLGTLTSANVVVGPAAANRLTILTQPSPTAAAGVVFAQQPVIRIEDAFGNLRNSDNTTVVTATRSAGSGTLQGTTNMTASGGVVTFTNIAHNVANTINLNFTSGSLSNAVSSNVVVSPAAFTKLQLLSPGESAAPGTASGKTGSPTTQAAGAAFNLTVNAVDAFWNLVTNVTDTVGLTTTDTNATPPANTPLVAGTQTFSLTFKTAGSATVTATDVDDGTKTASTSPSITVNAGAFAKLQILAPGETAAPGTGAGKTGTPTAQTAGTGFSVTVRAVDANWNLIGTNDTVAITSSDANATLPANAALTSGTRSFSVTNKTAGNWTFTASDVTHAGITASTSAAITVNAGAFAKLQILVPGEIASPGSSTGKTGTPSAQTASTAFNVTVNAVDANWNFVNTVTDTVGITTTDANDTHPANAALVAGTQTFAVTFKTAGSWTVTATDTTDGTKTANTSPSITVVAGAFVKLQLLVPGETAAPGSANGKTGTPTPRTAGVAFNVTANAVDANWNLVNTVTHTVGITSSDGAATLPGNAALASGTRVFSVTLGTVGSQTVTATDITDGSKTANTSPAITVISGIPNKLTIQTQPSSTATAGVLFAQQPAVRVEDSAGNLIDTNGLVITAARGTGTGTLQGTLTAATVNGIATFTNLSYNVAETMTVVFTRSGLTSATSSNVVVSAAAFTKLQLLVPGETASPGSASGKTGTPSARTAGTAFSVTVNAVDAFWNLVNTVTDVVNISSTDTNAVLPSDAALVNGTNSFSVTFKTAGTQTLTATDVTDGGKTNNTSPSITVNAGAFVKMQLVMPGETIAPGTATGAIGTPTAQTAGTGYSVTIRAVDANWNLVSSANTVGVTSTDPNGILPANGALSAGTRTVSLTNRTAGSWTVTATNITDGTKTSDTSPVTVNPGAFTKLQLLVPGEAASPGSTTGKTGTPIAQTAGAAFSVTVNAVDANWNLINSVGDTVGITSSDTNATLPGNTALVSGTQTLSVTLRTAGTRTLTASDTSDGSKTANTSPNITVNAGAFVKLQLLVPGETAAPGSPTGKTGTPTAAGAGTAFNVTVRSVDADWNLVSSTHTVGITSSDTNATLPANAALVAGARTNSVTLRTLGPQTVTATDITDGTKTANTSPPITVGVGAANKLTIQTQPSSTATAGVAFAQQPVIRVEDPVGNLVTNDNGRTITAARGTGTGTLQGTLTATTVNGIATFANLSYNVAETITINFTASGLTSTNSSNVVVSPTTATQLAFSTQPGGTARTGSPLATQPVVQARDAFGNNSAVGLPANLTLGLTLTGGSGALLGTTNLDIGTAAGNGTATFTTVECSDAGSNKVITASASGLTSAVSAAFFVGGVERATGGTAIPSSFAGTTYTNLTGPVYYEVASADAGADSTTIILNVPSGFIFDTGGAAPTVRVDRLSGNGANSKNINAVASGTSLAITSRSATQITFTVTNASSGVTCSLTWQNIRVQPSASSPLASGNITKTGTAAMAAVTNSSTSFGRLIEIGPASQLVIQTQPSSTATAGVVFAQQPVIRTLDSAGNFIATNGLVVTAARGTGTGTLQGTLTATTVNGVATFTNLSYNVAETITINFTSGSLTSTSSASVVVSPAAASQLAFTTQPANGTNGAVLATQPVVRTRDQFSNNSTVGLAGNNNVTVTLTGGTGPLLGTTTLDIGTNVGNGVVTFTNLRIDSAGTNKQLTASASGLSNAVSSTFTVAKANQTITFGSLTNKTYGDAAFNVSATASSGLAVTFSIFSGPATISGNTVTITGAGTVTVRASQAGNDDWNAAADVDQSFTVAKAELTVTANNTNRVYGAANPVFTASYSGFVNDETLATSGVTGSPSLTTSATTNSPVAGSPYTITAAVGSLSSANYSFTFVNGELTVTRATLTVTADDLSRTYGAPNPALTASYSGFVNGETTNVLSGSPSLSTTATTNSTVAGSPYAISVTQGSLSAANYEFSFVSGSLTVTAAPLSVTANDAARLYGQTNPVFTGTLTGVLNEDDITASYASSATTNSPVGTYAIVPSLADPNSRLANYTVSSTNGTLTISAAALTGTVDDKSRPYGETNPVFTVQYSGFVNGEDESVLSGVFVGTTAATTNSPVGTYPISGLGQSASNYVVSYVDGTLTVTPYALSVVADDATRTYGATNPIFTGTLTGVQAGDDITAAYASAATANSPVGEYAIVPSLVDPDGRLTNYTVFATNGTLTVTPAALSVTADDATRIYGQTNPVFTGTLTGVLNDDGITATYVCSATNTSPVGTYPIVPSLVNPDGRLTNYSVLTTNGTLTITPATTTNSLTTSTNPALPGTTVTFTATVSVVAPGSGTPSGTVQFTSDGSPIGAPAALGDGVASLDISTLPHGAHVIAAEYEGDGNFFGTTNALGSAQIINTPPVASPHTLALDKNTTVNVSATKFANTDTDADSDPRTITAVSATSAQGGTVSLSGTTITFTPVTNYTGADSFTYTLSDPFGGTATGTVNVTVRPGTAQTQNIVAITQQPDGNYLLTLAGISGRTYYIQATENISSPSWETIGTNTAGTNGLFTFYDLDATNHTTRYYRSAAP